MWERYCRGVQAIVYVVDAADHDGLDSGRQELHGLLQKPSLAHTPLLVLGNKNDLPGALSTTELIERLDLKVGLFFSDSCDCMLLSADRLHLSLSAQAVGVRVAMSLLFHCQLTCVLVCRHCRIGRCVSTAYRAKTRPTLTRQLNGS